MASRSRIYHLRFSGVRSSLGKPFRLCTDQSFVLSSRDSRQTYRLYARGLPHLTSLLGSGAICLPKLSVRARRCLLISHATPNSRLSCSVRRSRGSDKRGTRADGTNRVAISVCVILHPHAGTGHDHPNVALPYLEAVPPQGIESLVFIRIYQRGDAVDFVTRSSERRSSQRSSAQHRFQRRYLSREQPADDKHSVQPEPMIVRFWNPMTTVGRAAPDAVVTQQAQVIVCIDDYKLLMIATVACTTRAHCVQEDIERGRATAKAQPLMRVSTIPSERSE